MQLARRLSSKFAKNFISYGYNQFVTIAIQFLSVPAFLYFWDTDLYAEWLVLSSALTLLGLLDLGVSNATSSKAAMSAGGGDAESVVAALQTSIVFTLAICFTILASATASTQFADWQSTLAITEISAFEVDWVVVALSAHLCFVLLGGPINSWFIAVDRASAGFFLLANRRLLDVFVTIGILAIGGGPRELATSLALVQLASLIAITLYLASRSSLRIIGFRSASWTELRSLLTPAAGHGALSIAQVVGLQAGIQILNQFSTPLSVVVYSMGRTLMRLVLQIGYVANHALRPEVSRSVRGGTFERAEVQIRRVSIGSLLVGATFYLSLVLIGPWLTLTWSAGTTEISRTVLAILGLHALLSLCWFVPATLEMALNKLGRLAVAYVVGTLIAIAIWLMRGPSETPLIDAAFALALPELCSLVMVLIARRTRS